MKKGGVGAIASVFLIAIAVVIDALQALIALLALVPFVGLILSIILGFVVSIFAIFLFAIWFSHLNINLMKRYPTQFLGIGVLENIPVVSTVPSWTWFVITTLAKEKLDALTSSDT